MTTVIAVVLLVLLFMVFPFIRRERGSSRCGGCALRRRLGAGCGRCDDVGSAGGRT